jgi:hypothetical protein
MVDACIIFVVSASYSSFARFSLASSDAIHLSFSTFEASSFDAFLPIVSSSLLFSSLIA